jgi:hypothetical protein
MTRFAAAYVVGDKGLPWADELITLVRDRDPLVRQAARRGLVMLSNQVANARQTNQPGTKARAVDFGPTPNAATPGSWATAAQQWQRWLNQNKGYLPASPGSSSSAQ